MRELAELFLALLGVWFAVDALAYVGSFVALLAGIPDGGSLGSPVQFLPLAVYGLCAFVLVSFRKPLAAKLFPEAVEIPNPTSPDADYQPFLIGLLGIWVMLLAISTGAQIETGLLLEPSAGEFDALSGANKPREMFQAKAWAARLPYLIRLAGGALLFCGAGNIKNLWRKLRSTPR